MIQPPTLRSLIDDPVYRTYVKTIPRLPDNLTHGATWAVFAQSTSGRWLKGMYHTYESAWGITVKSLRSPRIRDVALVCRPYPFTEPGVWKPYRVRRTKPDGTSTVETRERFVPSLSHIIEWPYEWCGRCRRPTTYETYDRHHALPFISMTNEPRCFYCGLRRDYGV